MNHEDQNFEEFLRGFEPHRPRPLPTIASAGFPWRRFVAAAVLVAMAGGLTWIAIARRTRKPGDRPNLVERRAGEPTATQISPMELTRIALDDSKKFDSQMDELAPQTLPCCEGPRSSLAPLAKE